MNVRKAVEADLPEVFQVFQNAIRRMDESGIFQWDALYPTRADLQDDIEQGSLYVCVVGDAVAAAFALNQAYDPEYETGNWQYGQSRFYVLHRLCVDPAFQGKGIGTKAMMAAESVVKELGGESVRLDAFSQNPVSNRLYRKLGYAKAGEVRFRKGLFYLYEKKL